MIFELAEGAVSKTGKAKTTNVHYPDLTSFEHVGMKITAQSEDYQCITISNGRVVNCTTG